MLAIITLLLIIDLYTFKGVQLLLSGTDTVTVKRITRISYWAITFLVLGTTAAVMLLAPAERNPKLMVRFFLLAGITLTIYLPKIFFNGFHLTEDIGKLLSLGIARLFHHGQESFSITAHKILRFKLLSQIGMVLAIVPFIALMMGMIKGKFDFRTEFLKPDFERLPPAFDNLRIVQISDLHIGSFYGQEDEVKKAISMINKLEPDILVFTGDIVNDYAEELDGWVPILRQLNARIGKYSILGNHDYGDYYQWESMEAKKNNMERLIALHRDIGFKLLLNESVTIERDSQQITIIGVENWGKPPFAQYGNLKKAMTGTNQQSFKILLSHDPSHWDAEVREKTNIDLTLSGHTHAMQLGIKIGRWQWSPVKWKYKRWNGMYREGNQMLYVNRGLGFIGYPGRVGMTPEISVFDLTCK